MSRLAVLFLSVSVLLWTAPGARAADAEVGRDGGAARVSKLGVLEDNFPYSYRDADGEMTGFAYEVLRELERVMGLRFERIAGPTSRINADFAAGRIELMQSLAHFPEREGIADFSIPYLTMTGAIFVRDSEKNIRGIEDLRGRKVLVHAGSLGETVLKRAGLAESIVIVNSVEHALVRLAGGEGDATLATRLSGLTVAERLGIKNVRPLPINVPGYEVRYCVAVKKGEPALLAQINEGLAVLARTGEFDRIYRKWFGHLEPEKYSAAQIVGAVAVGLALALLVAISAMVRQRHLQNKIVRQAHALRLSEERHRGIFEGTRDGLLVIGRAGNGLLVEQINPAAVRLLGQTAHPGGVVSLAGLVGTDRALHAAVEAAIARGLTEEFEHDRSDGSGALRVRVTPLGAKSLLALTDVTEAVVARKRLQQQEEQLRQKQKLEAVGTLAGGVAHDFNNLLTAIMGNIELALLSPERDPTQTAGLKLALTAGKRARDLVRQILAFSRQNAPGREVVALPPLVEETIHLLRTLARGAVEFEVKLAADLPQILADPAQVYQVLMNLGTNAVQAMRGVPGRLSFVAEAIEVGAEIQAQHPDLRPGAIREDGPARHGAGHDAGSAAPDFRTVFHDQGAGRGHGVGAFGGARDHATARRGRDALQSGGARHALSFVFPGGRGERGDSRRHANRAAAFRQGAVLFVDDDPAVVQTTRGMLAHLGYEVSAHTRPEDAWADFQRSPGDFDLVISDLTMPGLNGLELFARIRGLRRGQSCVLSSGFFSDAECREATALELVLLPKPLSYESLGKAASAAMGRR